MSWPTWRPIWIGDEATLEFLLFLVARAWNGTYTVLYSLPDPAKTSGSLSIRAEADDGGGNDVSQTLLKAVKLAGPRGLLPAEQLYPD